MYYVKRALSELNKVIVTNASQLKKEREEFESNKKSMGKYFSDFDLGLNTISLRESDLSKLQTFESILKEGDIREALEFTRYLETAAREMIPHSTYELIGGTLIHEKHKSFNNEVAIDSEYKYLVSCAIQNYVKGLKDQAEDYEIKLNKKLQPFVLNSKTSAKKEDNKDLLLMDCLARLKKLSDDESKDLVKRIKKVKP